MKKMYIIWTIIVGFTLAFSVGIGLGIRISNSTEEAEYCKECPMCGSRVELNPIKNDWYIECQNWNCQLKTGYFHDKDKLIKKWNKMCEVEE